MSGDESIVRGHHVYKDTWTPTMGEILEVQSEPENEHDHWAVCPLKSGTIIGHLPRVESSGVSRSIGGRDRSTNNTSHHEIFHSFMASHPIVGYALTQSHAIDSISCLAVLKCMRLTNSKNKEKVCAYDKECAYKKVALNNPSLQYVLLS